MAVNNLKKTILIVTGILLVTLACNLTGATSSGPSSADLQMTQMALSYQATSLAIQQQQATMAAAAAQQQPQQPQQPQEPSPEPPQPTDEPPPTEEPPTEEPPVPTEEDIESRIKRANVLVFEDIWGWAGLSGDRRVSKAVASMHFSGGKVINVGDALGDFKSHLTSGTKWDIVVVSAEAHNEVKGEFWDYIAPLVDKKVALVAEVWYLDQISRGRIMPLLQDCGIDVQSDWTRSAKDIQSKTKILDYSILLLDPEHPIFNTPNSGISLTNPSNAYWTGDVGDRLKLDVGGDAQLLAGLYLNNKSNYGVLASCMDGRVIFQTFCTHDYSPKHTTALWENMITYTLTRRFETLGE